MPAWAFFFLGLAVGQVVLLVVLMLVGKITAAATYSLGRPLVDYYRFAQLILALPFP